MNTETLKQLDHDYEYSNRPREEIEDELVVEHRRSEVKEEIRHLESDEFRDLAMTVLDRF